MRFRPLPVLIVTLACSQPGGEPPVASESAMAVVPDIEDRLSQFAPTEITADLSALSDNERRVLDLLIEAAHPMDEIFLRQVWQGNAELRDRLASWEDPYTEAVRLYYTINFGPWDRLDEFKPFIGETPHPAGAGYYPEDLTKAEFESWIEGHAEEGPRFVSTTTVIRRRDGGLVAVPYSEEYRPWLEEAAGLLLQAAERTDNTSLRRFLELRAEAFSSDDYYESDMAWMDLDSPVEITIGPYETYEDAFLGYKAAFEAFVTVSLPEESRALEHYKSLLPWLERNLPIPDEHKNLERGTESPIRVADEVFAAGDTKAGVQTLAFNLPNDERVREEKGSRKVMLRNVLEAKYARILRPIAERVLARDQLDRVSFDAFYNDSLHHELSHGLGPGKIRIDDRDTEVRLELKELDSPLEEAKADVMGIYNILALIEKGEMPGALRESIESTYVAGLFRSARFGVQEAHGRGVIAQFNYLLEEGALEVDEGGSFRALSEKFAGAMRALLHDILMLQATGDYAGAAAFLARYGRPSEELLAAIERLSDVPVDIRPIYTAVPSE